MMKRTRFILLAVVAALVLMGAGYAAWTQTFTISSNVSAGELFVQVLNGETTVEVYNNNTGQWDGVEDEEHYLTWSVDKSPVEVDEDGTLSSITYSINNMYPGTKLISTITFENKGTIKVETSGSYVDDPELNTDLLEYLVVSVDEVEIVGSTGEDKLSNLKDAIVEKVATLDVNSQATSVKLEMKLPFDESGNETENLSMNWTIQLKFEQYNK